MDKQCLRLLGHEPYAVTFSAQIPNCIDNRHSQSGAGDLSKA